MLAARGARLHHVVQVLEKRAVTASHIANTQWLPRDRTIENLDDDLIHFPEIRRMRAAAAPNIHSAIHQQLDAILIHSRKPRVSKKKRAQHVEHRQVGNRYTVRCCDLRGVSAA